MYTKTSALYFTTFTNKPSIVSANFIPSYYSIIILKAKMFRFLLFSAQLFELSISPKSLLQKDSSPSHNSVS